MLFVKFWKTTEKFETFEYLFLKTRSQENYYKLFKVVLFNFAIGHFLSISLNLLARIGPENNWYQKLGIENDLWHIKYIWGFYWGANGFGELLASNTTEALGLILIETFGAMILAYNVSKVGSLILEINEKNDEKQHTLKTFHKMCKEDKITDSTE